MINKQYSIQETPLKCVGVINKQYSIQEAPKAYASVQGSEIFNVHFYIIYLNKELDI